MFAAAYRYLTVAERHVASSRCPGAITAAGAWMDAPPAVGSWFVDSQIRRARGALRDVRLRDRAARVDRDQRAADAARGGAERRARAATVAERAAAAPADASRSARARGPSRGGGGAPTQDVEVSFASSGRGAPGAAVLTSLAPSRLRDHQTRHETRRDAADERAHQVSRRAIDAGLELLAAGRSGSAEAPEGYRWVAAPHRAGEIGRKEIPMEPWVWVIIAVAAVLLLLLLFRGRGTAGGRRVVVQRRAPRRRRWI